MFLESLKKRNPDLIRTAVELHQSDHVPPNSYVIDLDTVQQNAELVAAEANTLDLTVLAMTKQLGRVPPVLAAIERGGINSFVAVDTQGGRIINAAGYRVGHVGHLVQVPASEVPAVLRMAPDYWTVFSSEQARNVSTSAVALGSRQQVLVRVHREGDTFYTGHEGGVELSNLESVYQELASYDGIEVVGVTTFPALLFDERSNDVYLTPNMKTVEEAATLLQNLGLEEVHVNAPGTTSTETLQRLADAGATQVEPGHGLTATTPWHAVRELPEKPAVLYLSEVSHLHDGRGYCFGGGLYIDPVFDPYQVRALVGHGPDQIFDHVVDADLPPYEAIDYYGQLDAAATHLEAGDSVVFGFRIQAFVTRAYVVPIAGLSTGRPRVAGIWHASGTLAQWP